MSETEDLTLFQRISRFVLQRGVPSDQDALVESVNEFVGEDVTEAVTRLTSPPRARNMRAAMWVHMRTWLESFRNTHGMPHPNGNGEVYSRGFIGYVGRGVGRRAHRSIWVYNHNVVAILDRILEYLQNRLQRPILISEQFTFHIPVLGETDNFNFVQLMTSDTTRRIAGGTNGYLEFRDPVLSDFIPHGARFEMGNIRDLLTAISSWVAQAEAEGWAVTYADCVYYDYNEGIYLRDENNETESFVVPMWALPPAESDLHGRCAIKFFSLGHNARSEAQVFAQLLLAMDISTLGEEVDSQHHEAISIFHQLYTAGRNLNGEVSILRDQISNAQRHIDEYANSIASNIRANEDRVARLSSITHTLPQQALSYVERVLALPETLASLRQISAFEIITEGTASKIKFTTHPFGMRCVIANQSDFHCDECNSDRCQHATQNTVNVLIPAMQFVIDTSRPNFNGSVTVSRVSGRGPFHPHATSGGAICWGYAAHGLAEAWGRRDWESFIRLILGWCTVYNDHSPHNTAQRLLSANGAPSRLGWITDGTGVAEDAAEAPQDAAERDDYPVDGDIELTLLEDDETDAPDGAVDDMVHAVTMTTQYVNATPAVDINPTTVQNGIIQLMTNADEAIDF